MEVALGRSDHESRVKEEKTTESGGPDHGDEDHPKQEIDIEVEELESAKTEMGEAREENQRLKQCLDRVMKDYRTLEMKFKDVFQKETKHQSATTCSEPDDLVSLSLGRVICSNDNNNNARTNDDDHQKSKALKALLWKDNNGDDEEEDLALGLACKFETSKSGSITNNSPNITNPSPTNSSDQERVNNESKALKTSRDSYSGEDEVSQHNPPKRARVCVRARCDAPTMNDGCQWRKYGQKISKGNPCPRAYYRCTVAPSCPVKKQVQRCAEDMSVLVATYEGIHNHPLPLSATAMASTTSAAASMLLSPSSLSSSTAAATTATTPLYFSNNPSSLSSSSSLPSHPTITLDLTTNSAASRFFMTSSSSSSNYNPPPRSSSFRSSASLNFSSPNNNNFLSYNSNNRNLFSSMNLARSTTMDNNIYRLPYVQKNSVINNPTHHHPPPQPAALPDSIAAATKAIAADPKFQSALAVALSSFIGSTGGSGIGSSSQIYRVDSI
ncbi:hypothetical protein QN277_025432 [Acacia crassicarpa]|uniref:WRKY domain-containing protein n=1 Tax=Acacia crassicarpa TaxID=499986 RepID=A0AAE1J9S8_9FABA|nr:hypothetical protein QN277_025432 [Acacia crassicarpa]